MIDTEKIKLLESQIDTELKIYEKKVSKIRKERNELREKITRQRLEQFIGKSYIFMNSYGSGKKWKLYKKVIGTNEYDLTIISFQDAGEGFHSPEILLTTNSSTMIADGSHKRISNTLFNKELKKSIKKITDANKRIIRK